MSGLSDFEAEVRNERGSQWSVLLLLLAAMALLGSAGSYGMTFYTSRKMQAMRMVRGEIPGADFVEAQVVAVAPAPGERLLVTLRCVRNGPQQFETTLFRDRWPGLSAGENFTLAFLPGRRTPKVQGGVWASKENLWFDSMLLRVEQAGAVLMLLATLVFLAFALWLRSRELERP